MLDIAVAGDDISITEDSVDAQGVAETVTLADGFAIERLHERAWRARGTKAENLIFTDNIVLASDGTYIREEAETTLADGSHAPATLIYERQ